MLAVIITDVKQYMPIISLTTSGNVARANMRDKHTEQTEQMTVTAAFVVRLLQLVRWRIL